MKHICMYLVFWAKCQDSPFYLKIRLYHLIIQVNLDMTDSMGPGKLVRHMQNPSYTYDEYLICIGLGPSISSVICKNPSYSGPSYASSPVYVFDKVKGPFDLHFKIPFLKNHFGI